MKIGSVMLGASAPYVTRQFKAICGTPSKSQQRLLDKILRTNADTEFGRTHGFERIKTFREFQERVPISSYQDLEPYIRAEMEGEARQLTKSAPVLFTTTSGTTGASKYIPMTQEGKRAKSRLMWLWLSTLYRDHPGVSAGKILSIVSPEVESYAPNGTPCGAESGHAYRTMPKPVRWMYSTPYAVFAIEDYEAKYYTLLRVAVGQNISSIVTANPSTIVLIGDRLAQQTESLIRDVRNGSLSSDFSVPQHLRASLRLRPDPKRATQLERAAEAGNGSLIPGLVWPNIAALGCWKGGTVGSYLAKFDALFPERPPVRDIGYLATEVRGSVPLNDESDAGVVTVGTNVLEFQPVDDGESPQSGDLLPVHELEDGRRYFIFVTTGSGLYRYDMNDIVEVAGQYEGTPLIRFVQKGKGVVSFTGEKLYEVQVIAAVEDALAELKGKYHFIAAVAEMLDAGLPRLVFLIEFDNEIPASEGSILVNRIDQNLGKHNIEYESKRKSLRYGAPAIRVVRSGEFDKYRRRKVEGGRADGQFKVLRLTSDPSFAAEFEAERDFVGAEGTPVSGQR
jgi:hypothetical protein